MKPREPKDFLYLIILSAVVSGLLTGAAWVVWWLFQEVNVWLAVFVLVFIVVWIMEVSKDE